MVQKPRRLATIPERQVEIETKSFTFRSNAQGAVSGFSSSSRFLFLQSRANLWRSSATVRGKVFPRNVEHISATKSNFPLFNKSRKEAPGRSENEDELLLSIPMVFKHFNRPPDSVHYLGSASHYASARLGLTWSSSSRAEQNGRWCDGRVSYPNGRRRFCSISGGNVAS